MRYNTIQNPLMNLVESALSYVQLIFPPISFTLFLVLLSACQSSTIDNSAVSANTRYNAAAPSAPVKVTTTQPDGYSFEVLLHGDEHTAWHETVDGYSIVKSPQDKVWYYATCKDKALVPSAYRVGDPLPKSWPRHLRPQINGCEK